MRIAMLGLGDIAQKAYLPVVASHPAITPILCTRNNATLAKLASQYRIDETYNNLNDLLVSWPDAVMIHSSTECHYAIAKQCLDAGIPVFIDKPLSYHYAECEQLVNLAIDKDLPLIMGFNRRFAPLYQPFNNINPIQIHYQKNRHNLPAAARPFIFDDFIHVLDFLLYCSPDTPEKIDVFTSYQQQLLATIQVSWQTQGSLFVASMNRINGVTEERLEYYAENKKWQIENLRQGRVWQNNTVTELNFNDWENTLYKRGFISMIDDMLLQLEKGVNNPISSQQILRTHSMCEQIVEQVNIQNQ